MHRAATDGMNGRNWKQKIQGSSSSYTLIIMSGKHEKNTFLQE